MKKKGGVKYSDAMFLFKTTPIITHWIPQAGLPTLPDIIESTLSFTNSTYPDLSIKLPKSITDIAGTYIKLPTISGEYEDEYNVYTPLKWDIGDFGEYIKLKKHNIKANLVFTVIPKINTYIVDFTNTTYPQFPVSLPQAIHVPEGDSVILPSVSGGYEDEEYIYTPLEWTIGSFGASFTPDSDIITNLVWNVQQKTIYYTLSFTNTEYPQFDVSLPESIVAEEGNSVLLPTITGEYEDERNIYIPDKWSVGEFGENITLNENKVADLVWFVSPIEGRFPLGGTVGLGENLGEYIYYDYDSLVLKTTPNYNYSNDLSIFELITGGTVKPYVPDDSVHIGGLITNTDDQIIRINWEDGLVSIDDYAYSNTVLLDNNINLSGLVYLYVPTGDLIFVDSNSGAIIESIDDPINIVYAETSYYTITNNEKVIFCKDLGNVDYISLFFTNNGKHETENSILTNSNSLYNELGEDVLESNVEYSAYNQKTPLALMDVDGNIYEADSTKDSLNFVSGKGVLVLESGSTSLGKEAWSVLFEKQNPSPEPPTPTSNRFIDVTETLQSLNPEVHYECIDNHRYGVMNCTINGETIYLFPNDNAGCLQEYISNPTAYWDEEFLLHAKPESTINKHIIPLCIYLNPTDSFGDPINSVDSRIIDALGLTQSVAESAPNSAILRIMVEVSGNTLGDLDSEAQIFTIIKAEFIRILYSYGTLEYTEEIESEKYLNLSFSLPDLDYDTDEYSGNFNITVGLYKNGDGFDVGFYNGSVPQSSCFLTKNGNVSDYSFMLNLSATDTTYGKPITVIYSDVNGIFIIIESTPYDLT